MRHQNHSSPSQTPATLTNCFADSGLVGKQKSMPLPPAALTLRLKAVSEGTLLDIVGRIPQVFSA